MVTHLLSVTEWGHVPRTPSDAQLLQVARDTLYAAEMKMIDRSKNHPFERVGPVQYTLAIVLGAELTCREEPHRGIEVPALTDADRAEAERLWEQIRRLQRGG